jgi:HSP20 family protein
MKGVITANTAPKTHHTQEKLTMRLIRYTTPNTRSFAPAFGVSSRSPWTGLENEINQLFETALSGVAAGQSRTEFPVDLYEDKENTYVRAELPGVTRDAISVEMVEGYLTITAARKEKTGEQEESLSFSRSISIPDEIQADKVSAAYLDGVLTVTLPKREEVKPKKISVAVK